MPRFKIDREDFFTKGFLKLSKNKVYEATCNSYCGRIGQRFEHMTRTRNDEGNEVAIPISAVTFI